MIRPARATDVGAMVEIARASFSIPWSADAFSAHLGALTLVEERDGRVVGYTVARHTADEAEILDLAVRPESRRSGTAARLVDAVCSRAGALGARRVFLEVRLGNAAARALYHARGFAEIGRRAAYYEAPAEDALVLALEIGRFSGSA